MNKARPIRCSARSKSARGPIDILTEQVGFPPEDIIFDPNIFAVATGIEEHNDYAVAFIEATGEIRAKLPHAHVPRRTFATFLFRFAAMIRCAKRCIRYFCTTPSRQEWTWVLSMPASWRYIRIFRRRTAGAGSRMCIFNRRADATERLLDLAQQLQGRWQGGAKSGCWPGVTCR